MNFINKRIKFLIIAIYTLLFVYTIAQGIYYANKYPGTSPDETAHISYVYYLTETGYFIPHFEDMRLFNAVPMKWSDENYMYVEDSYNYLCHPPLYYQIMRLAGGFSTTDTDGIIHIEKMRLRYFSLVISSIGLAILLYIGFSRIDKTKPWLHLLYACAATAVPLMSFEMCAVTNDSLALVTGSICILGLIRFAENKRGYLTYILIAVGITSSLLTKMTTAMLCVIASLLVLIISIIKEKGFRDSLKKEFFITSPIYLIALIYFSIIYSRYGVLQPSLELISSTEYLQSTIFYTAPGLRTSMTFFEYLAYYLNSFFRSWSGISADVDITKLSAWDKYAIASEALWFIPLLVFITRIKKSAGTYALPVMSGWIACIVTFLVQLKNAYGTFQTRGYMGGFNSRYYIPFLAIFALGTVLVFNGIHFKDKKLNYLVMAAAIIFSILLIMGSFPFYLIYYCD